MSKDFTVLSRAIVNGQQMGRLLKVMPLFQRGVIQVTGWKSKLLGSGLFRKENSKGIHKVLKASFTVFETFYFRSSSKKSKVSTQLIRVAVVQD